MFFHHRMKLLDKIGREFSGYNILESGKRLVDRKPLQCSLYVTDRCNLDCAYCTEYDNSWPHPGLDDLKKRIREIVARAKRVPSMVSPSSSLRTNNMRSLGVTNPDGTHEVNGRTNGSPSADDGVTLRKG